MNFAVKNTIICSLFFVVIVASAVLWAITTVRRGRSRCHDFLIGGGVHHSDYEWEEGVWLRGCGLQWSVLGLCVLIIIDFLGYLLWAYTTIMDGADGWGGRPVP